MKVDVEIIKAKAESIQYRLYHEEEVSPEEIQNLIVPLCDEVERLQCDCEYLGQCKDDPQKTDYCPLMGLEKP